MPKQDNGIIPGMGGETMREETWLRPKLVAQVIFGVVRTGLLRHTKFAGIREDKNPREFVRE
jgi:bifunctional non-homologous end joining protein LigD